MFLIYLYLQGFMHPVDLTISAVSKRSRPKYADSYFLDIEHAMHMHIMQKIFTAQGFDLHELVEM